VFHDTISFASEFAFHMRPFHIRWPVYILNFFSLMEALAFMSFTFFHGMSMNTENDMIYGVAELYDLVPRLRRNDGFLGAV